MPAWATFAVLALCAAAVAAAWGWAVQGGSRWRYAATLVGVLVAASWIVELRRRPAHRLSWDGAAWRLGPARRDDDGLHGDVAAVIDLGDRLLLRFTPAGRRVALWLPLHRGTTDGDWHALRCALHARHAAAAAPPTGALGA